MNEIQTQYLESYLNALTTGEREKYSSFSAGYFCADKRNADICSDLVLRDIKTATCSMKYWYDNNLAPAPVVGHLQVVLNWEGVPTSIIETLSVSDVAFCDVPESFAIAEGEGDKSLQWWRHAHWNHFSRESKEMGFEPSDDMLLVLETFRVVHS